jgi:hypothetical protein
MIKRITPLILLLLAACTAKVENSTPVVPIVGTWKLISGTLITSKDTTVTDYLKGKSSIKVINDTHFAFMVHDLTNGKDSTNSLYASGGGKYDLVNDNYTEHLEYCSAREWEGHDFSFKITIRNDTLIQEGREEVESAGVSQLNIERYVRL